MRLSKKPIIIFLGVFFVIAIVITIAANQALAYSQAVPGKNIPPTPILKPSDLIASNNEIESQPNQRTISRFTDLADGIPEENKILYVVQQIDGEYEQFLVPANFPGDIRKLMELNDSDKIITGFALVSIHSTPAMIDSEMQSTQIAHDNPPYPVPDTQEAFDSPVNPYPYP